MIARGPSLAIGYQVGNYGIGSNTLAIGYQAGFSNQGLGGTAVGNLTGAYSQGIYGLGLGNTAGYSNQGTYATAIGYQAGFVNQCNYAVGLGYQAGYSNQGSNAIAIGTGAGYVNQSTNSIAIGWQAGAGTTATSSIILNASGAALNTSTPGLFVSPVRFATGGKNIASFNTTTSELYYSDTAQVSTLTASTIGIGTTTPAAPLQVASSASFSNFSFGQPSGVNGYLGNVLIGSNASGYGVIQTNGAANGFLIGGMTSGGTVQLWNNNLRVDCNAGFGVDPGTYKVNVSGSINFTGSLYSNGSLFSGGAPAGINSAGNIGINSASNASNALLVTGSQSNTGDLFIGGTTFLVASSNSGTLGVAGVTTLSNSSNTGTLGVAGAATFNSNLSVNRTFTAGQFQIYPQTTNGYTIMGLKGGNTIGYLYGDFQLLGDGIHLGYNYYGSNGTAYSPAGFGNGGSRISMGYGTISLNVGSTSNLSTMVYITTNQVSIGAITTAYGFYAPTPSYIASISFSASATYDNTVNGAPGFGIGMVKSGLAGLGPYLVASIQPPLQIANYYGINFVSGISGWSNGASHMCIVDAKVGINCNAPSKTLDVNGSVNIGPTTQNVGSNSLFVSKDIPFSNITSNQNPYNYAQVAIGGNGSTARLYLGAAYTGGAGAGGIIQASDYFSSTDNGVALFLNPKGGNIGVGSSNYPETRLQVVGNTVSLNAHIAPAADIFFSVLGSNTYNTSTRTMMEIGSYNSDNGNFNGVYKFLLGFSNTTTGAGGNFIIQSVPTGSASYTSNGTILTPFTIAGTTGNIGINCNAPARTLDVTGTFGVSGITTLSSNISFAGGSFTTTNTQPRFYDSTSLVRLGWNTSADTFFGVTSGRSFYFQVNGANVANVGPTGTYTGSDRRIKKNILPNTNSLEIVNKLNIYCFDFIDNIPQSDNSVQHGLIAQEVLEVYPSAVSYSEGVIPTANCIAQTVLVDSTVQITTTVPHQFSASDMIDLLLDGRRYNFPIASIISDTEFTVAVWDNYDATQEVIVFGKKINDFLSIDKSQFGILAAGACKILSQEISTLKAENMSQQSTIMAILANLNL
jgi:hypothetical protein